jgi:serine phosphatase RsbU (regulator of sigma subunit)
VRRALDDARRLVVIDRELSIARRIQSSILPQSMPRLAGLTIAARYRPMSAVAGDFCDFLETDAHRLGILVADVSGHGVPAALIASMVKVALAA